MYLILWLEACVCVLQINYGRMCKRMLILGGKRETFGAVKTEEVRMLKLKDKCNLSLFGMS